MEARKSQDVSHKAVNQSDSHKMGQPESLPKPLSTRTSLGINNRTAVKKGYEVMNSVKMRDLKSNSKLNGKQSSSLSSKSFKTLLSKSSSRRTKRSSLQVVNGVLICYLFVSVVVIEDFKIQRHGRQQERQKNNRFNKQNNNFTRASRFFYISLPVFARLRRENA